MSQCVREFPHCHIEFDDSLVDDAGKCETLNGTLIANHQINHRAVAGVIAMFIHEMSINECYSALLKANVGRLACSRDGQPYAVPINFAFDGTYLYGFTTLGQKIECMRANPLVCLEIDEIISPSEWLSIVVFGRYEELPDEPKYEHARIRAHAFLQQRAMWWEPACISQEHRDQTHSLIPIFYRIHIKKITGHRATPDDPALATAQANSNASAV